MGEFIEIRGRKSTVAPVFPLGKKDEGKGRIRTDGLVRTNAQGSLHDKVTVQKADVHPAEAVAFSPVVKKGHVMAFGPGVAPFLK